MAPLIIPQLYPTACDRQILLHRNGFTAASEDVGNGTTFAKSQSGEDLLLYQALFKDDTRPGTFLEIGALDGNRYSNTYFYEHALGWRGAHPENAAKLMKADRPRTARFSVAICKIPSDREPGQLEFSAKGSPVSTALDIAAHKFSDVTIKTFALSRAICILMFVNVFEFHSAFSWWPRQVVS